MQAARDKLAHTPRSYPEGNLCRDPTDNKREQHTCGMGRPKCRARGMWAGASDIQAQYTATLDIPPRTVKTSCWFVWRCAGVRPYRPAEHPRAAHGMTALLMRSRSCQVHHHPANPTAWAQRCELDGTEDFLM
jgi:hypothetical protein